MTEKEKDGIGDTSSNQKWIYFDSAKDNGGDDFGVEKIRRKTYKDLNEKNVEEEEASYVEGSFWYVTRKCLKLLFKHKWLGILTALFGLGAGGCRTAFLFFINKGFSGPSPKLGENWTHLAIFITGMLVSILGTYYLQYKSQVTSQDLLRLMQLDILERAFKALFRRPRYNIEFEENINIRLVMRADVRAVRNVAMGLINFFLQTIIVLSAYIALVSINWQIGLTIGFFMLFMFFIIQRQNKTINLLSIKFRRHILEHVGVFSSVLRSLKFAVGIGNTASFRNAFRDVIDERLRIRMDLVRAKAKAIMILGFGSMGGMLVILLSFLIMNSGTITISKDASLITCLMAFFMMLGPLASMINLEKRIIEFMPLARHHFNMAEEWTNYENDEEDKPLLRGSIKKLEFTHLILDVDKPKQLTPWELALRSGNIYGLVARKAPVFRVINDMLSRMSIPKEGNMLIDGIDYREFTKSSVIRALGYLNRKPTILPTTIKNNIILDLQMDEGNRNFEYVTKLLHLEKAFSNLPDGINTNLRSSNVHLSQQGKILIQCARILMTPTKIYMIELDVLENLGVNLHNIFLEELGKRKDESIIIIKPKSLDHLSLCTRILIFKGYDLVFDAAYRDLEDGTQRDLFYINPDSRVCGLPAYSKDPVDWPTFGRALFGYEVFKKTLADRFANVIANGDELFEEEAEFEDQIMEEEDMDIELL